MGWADLFQNGVTCEGMDHAYFHPVVISFIYFTVTQQIKAFIYANTIYCDREIIDIEVEILYYVASFCESPRDGNGNDPCRCHQVHLRNKDLL
jgi:hypothetical protein